MEILGEYRATQITVLQVAYVTTSPTELSFWTKIGPCTLILYIFGV